MNRKVIRKIAIVSVIVTVTVAFKNLVGNTTKVKSIAVKNSKKILGISDAISIIMQPNSEGLNFMVKGYYKSYKNVDNALVVTLSSVAKDSGSFKLLSCYFVDENKPQLKEIPVNAELVIAGNPLPTGSVAQIANCQLISINMPDLSANF